MKADDSPQQSSRTQCISEILEDDLSDGKQVSKVSAYSGRKSLVNLCILLISVHTPHFCASLFLCILISVF